MKLSLIRSMTRSAVFELENGLCYRPAHPFTVQLNGKTVYEACNTLVQYEEEPVFFVFRCSHNS